MIQAEAQRQGVPPDIAIAVARRESGLNPNVGDGGSGEIGLFQVKPATALDMGVTDLRDLDENIRAGVAYLAWNFSRYGDWNQALTAYNGGPGNVDRGTISSAAANYAQTILASIGWGPSSGAPWTPPVPSRPPYVPYSAAEPDDRFPLYVWLALGAVVLILVLD